MKTIIALLLLTVSVGTTHASILSCSSGYEYKSQLKLVSNRGKYDRYRVIGTSEFISCVK